MKLKLKVESFIRQNQVNSMVYGQDSKKKLGRSVGKIKILFDSLGWYFFKNNILHSKHGRKIVYYLYNIVYYLYKFVMFYFFFFFFFFKKQKIIDLKNSQFTKIL